MQTEQDKIDPVRKQPEWRKLIFFNGPSRCGKSFGAECMMRFVRVNAGWTNPRMMDFAEPLKKAAHALYASFNSWDHYEKKEHEHEKSLSCGDFLGMSPREAYIEMFNDLERRHGPEVLGFLLRKRIIRENFSKVFIMPNTGRLPELDPLINLVGQRSILLVEVHAADRTFDGDIRGYIGDAAKDKYPHITVMKLPNVFGSQEDKDFYRMLCEGAAKKFLKIEEKDG